MRKSGQFKYPEYPSSPFARAKGEVSRQEQWDRDLRLLYFCMHIVAYNSYLLLFLIVTALGADSSVRTALLQSICFSK